MDTPSFDQIATQWTIDYEASEIELSMVDGSTITGPLTNVSADSHGSIVRASFNATAGQIELEFSFDETVCLDVGPREIPDVPVVYLDQNKWIALAQSRYSPDRLKREEAHLVSRLYELVASRQVLPPVSSAHMIEAAYKDGRPRQNLATVMWNSLEVGRC